MVSVFSPAVEMSAEEFREDFRGSAVQRAKRSGLRRNAVIAMGNSGDRRFGALLEKLKADEDEVVAESAGWAAKRLSQTNSGAMVSSTGSSETPPLAQS